MTIKFNQAVVLVNVPRSGSTLVGNLLRDIIGKDKVQPVLAYQIPYEYTIINIRDFRDCMCSWWRVHTKNKVMSFWEVIYYLFWVKRHIRLIRKYRETNKKVLYLRYEFLYKDFDYVFDNFEDYLNIKIPYELRDELKKKYHIKEMKKVSDKVKGFYEDRYNPKKFYLHGQHIGNKWGGSVWKEVIPYKYHTLVYYFLRKNLIEYTYGRDFISKKRGN